MRTIGRLLLLPAPGALCAGIALTAGLVDFSASTPPGRLEQRLATFALNRSIEHHAPKATDPLARSPTAVAAGLALFRTMPAFGASRSEEEVRQLVAALRRLPRLSPEERQMLARERLSLLKAA